MKIIGHRGAAGLALENTIESISEGVAGQADAIEIDIRLTHDKQIVLSHDEDLKRTYGVDLKIREHRLQDLRIPCPNLPTLEEALKACKDKDVIIELKEVIDPKLLFDVIDTFPKLNIRFASFIHPAIRKIKTAAPNRFCYLLEHHSPFEIINHAKAMKADGIGLNYSVLNPLTYFLARRQKLHIYVYTLNKPWIARWLHFLYRDIDICTDYPANLKELRLL